MTAPAAILKSSHLLGIEQLSVEETAGLLDLAEIYVTHNRDGEASFVLDTKDARSRARNMPFEGRKFQGRAKTGFADGRCVFPWQ